jgi:Tat protein translocase TatB subunit
MFGLGMPELLMILAIALIVIGPKKLPDLAKTLGRAMGEFKRSAQDFKRSIDMETTITDIEDIDEPETDLKDVVKQANSRKEQEKETNKGDEPAAEPGETTPGAEDTDNDVDADFTDTDKVD